jgi:hypothetical protein
MSLLKQDGLASIAMALIVLQTLVCLSETIAQVAGYVSHRHLHSMHQNHELPPAT